MDKALETKLKKLMIAPPKKVKKSKKKSKKMKKLKGARVVLGKYIGKRKNYKLYKVSPNLVIAIKSKKSIKGGMADETIVEAKYEQPEDSDFDNEFAGINEMFAEEAKEHYTPGDADIVSPYEHQSSSDEPVEVKKVEIISDKPKRKQSEGNKRWLTYVSNVAKIPAMKGKSRSYVMQQASILYKQGVPLSEACFKEM